MRALTMPDLNLKPCPFCGGAADFCLNNEWFNGCYRKLFIKCLKCGATGKPILMAASRWCPGLNGGVSPTMSEAKEIAAAHWNRCIQL